MKFKIIYLAIIIFFFAACSNLNYKNKKNIIGKFKKLEWISGTWKYIGVDYTITEMWIKLSDTLYKGVNYLVFHGDTTMAEVVDLRLRRDTIFYNVAFENSKKLAKCSYKSTKATNKMLVLENKKLVSQSKISYFKEKNNVLHIVIEGFDGTKNTLVDYYLKKQ